MTISSKYNPAEVEDKWYQHWLNQKFFQSKPNPNKEPFTIVMPPPNVTGVLHMGHMLNNTIQDILTRKARMQGKETLWVPGIDHASIATEAKVVNKLKEEGKDKKDLSRKEFVEQAWEWTHKHGGIILEQLKKLGASCDWDRITFTMDDNYYKSVISVFVNLYKKGYIYRDYRMIIWDPQAQTTISNEEVVYTEEHSKLYYLRYKVEGSKDYLIVATTRPETILGDSGVCVNPSDGRYKHLHGKRAIVPIIKRSVPIIQDEYVDMEFGTGCLKVTPAHDSNDYELGKKHGLEFINILNDDGTLNKTAQFYVGENRTTVRGKIAKELKTKGYLAKEEDYTHKVGRSDRTNAMVEPKLSIQWFLKMKEISQPALKAVMQDDVRLYPAKFKNVYHHWVQNVHEWCISRQLWWGHQIPAYYYDDGMEDFVIAESAQEALHLARKKTGNHHLTIENLKQDEDVMDTWASSWIWPIAVFNGILKPDNKEIKYYYPTNDLVTAPEILFFWVARMIMAGYEYCSNLPFRNVYFTGIVRDKQRRKMSKSLGNSPNPIKLIKQYGADGVRVGMLFSSPAGNDLLFDEKLVEQGRNFANKIWNAFRLIKGFEVSDAPQPTVNKIATEWFEARFNQVLMDMEDHFSKYRISDALICLYKLTRDDFCSWYLEIIKPEFGKPISRQSLEGTIRLLEKLMKVLHPFMPFITEEIWHNIKKRDLKDCVTVADYPKSLGFDKNLLAKAELAFEVISNIRNIRNSKGISPKYALKLIIKTKDQSKFADFKAVIIKLANISELSFSSQKMKESIGFVIKSDEFFIPIKERVNKEKEKKNACKELEYARGFLNSVEKKLNNKRFLSSAPKQIVENERKKKIDVEAKIKILEENLATLG